MTIWVVGVRWPPLVFVFRSQRGGFFLVRERARERAALQRSTLGTLAARPKTKCRSNRPARAGQLLRVDWSGRCARLAVGRPFLRDWGPFLRDWALEPSPHPVFSSGTPSWLVRKEAPAPKKHTGQNYISSLANKCRPKPSPKSPGPDPPLTFRTWPLGRKEGQSCDRSEKSLEVDCFRSFRACRHRLARSCQSQRAGFPAIPKPCRGVATNWWVAFDLLLRSRCRILKAMRSETSDSIVPYSCQRPPHAGASRGRGSADATRGSADAGLSTQAELPALRNIGARRGQRYLSSDRVGRFDQVAARVAEAVVSHPEGRGVHARQTLCREGSPRHTFSRL